MTKEAQRSKEKMAALNADLNALKAVNADLKGAYKYNTQKKATALEKKQRLKFLIDVSYGVAGVARPPHGHPATPVEKLTGPWPPGVAHLTYKS